MGHVHISPEAHLICQNLIETKGQFITMSLYLAQVHRCWRSTEVGRNSTVSTWYQNVNTLVTEEIKATSEETSENTEVNTPVPFLHCFPVNVWVANCYLTIIGINTLITRIGVQTSNSSVGSTVCPLVHVKPACIYVIITNLTIRNTELQHIHIFLNGLEELFFTG